MHMTKMWKRIDGRVVLGAVGMITPILPAFTNVAPDSAAKSALVNGSSVGGHTLSGETLIGQWCL